MTTRICWGSPPQGTNKCPKGANCHGLGAKGPRNCSGCEVVELSVGLFLIPWSEGMTCMMLVVKLHSWIQGTCFSLVFRLGSVTFTSTATTASLCCIWYVMSLFCFINLQASVTHVSYISSACHTFEWPVPTKGHACKPRAKPALNNKSLHCIYAFMHARMHGWMHAHSAQQFLFPSQQRGHKAFRHIALVSPVQGGLVHRRRLWRSELFAF